MLDKAHMKQAVAHVPWSKVCQIGDGRPPTFNDGILISLVYKTLWNWVEFPIPYGNVMGVDRPDTQHMSGKYPMSGPPYAGPRALATTKLHHCSRGIREGGIFLQRGLYVHVGVNPKIGEKTQNGW